MRTEGQTVCTKSKVMNLISNQYAEFWNKIVDLKLPLCHSINEKSE
jgi:hypothetical protein